jgi:hypothetical protein
LEVNLELELLAAMPFVAFGGKTGATNTIGAGASEANLLYLGSPNSLRDTEGYSFSRPVSILQAISFHLFLPRSFPPVIVSSAF